MNRKGRPQGAKNKLPNNELVNNLINKLGTIQSEKVYTV